MALMSAAEYAERRGVKERAIHKAVLAGRIPAKKSGRALRIDPVAADKAWPEMRKPRGVVRKKKNGAPTELTHDEMLDARFKARTDKDVYQARLIKMEFDRQSAKLIDAAEVEQSAFMVARTMRDALLNIPDRVAHILAGQTDAKAVHRTLTDEILQVCADMQKAVSGMAEQ